jgi:hypothetical protein
VIWHYTQRADQSARKVADNHYSRQQPGTPQFTPPGRILTLHTADYEAVWATSWPFARYVNRVYPDAWLNSIFRREEGSWLASEMIRQAVAATLWYFGQPPKSGMVTMIDKNAVAPIKRRGKYLWGYSYRQAGFIDAGHTKGGLLILQLLPADMPEPIQPLNTTLPLFGIASAVEVQLI